MQPEIFVSCFILYVIQIFIKIKCQTVVIKASLNIHPHA